MDKEINLIEDVLLKDDIYHMVKLLPEYFWNVPASSTGKYHPRYACSENGLVKHTKAAVRIAYDLLNLESNEFNQEQKDIIIASLILHDGLKSGWKEGYTQFEHPLYMSNFIEDEYKKGNLKSSTITLNSLRECISSHMGQWNTNPYLDVVLPKPTTEMQKFVHMCDYLASRKYLEVPFNQEIEIEE